MVRKVMMTTLLALALVACGDDDGSSPGPDAGSTDASTGGDASTSTGTDAGTDAGSADELIEDIEAANLAIATEICDCFGDEDEFATTELCIEAQLGSAASRACDLTAFEAAGAGIVPYLGCAAGSAQTVASCFEAAACDETALGACEGTECPNPPNDAIQAFQTARAACVASNVVGTTASACPEGDESSALGAAVFSGTTVGGADDFQGGCDGLETGSADRAFRWVAPSTGTFRFDTIGSAYDTTLYLRSACDAPDDIVCNDDADTGDTLRSALTVALESGDAVIVVVDGYSPDDAGSFVVNVTEVAPPDEPGEPGEPGGDKKKKR